jgi:hypothetical protein
METDLHEFVMGRLAASRGKWRDVAKGADVPYDTLTKIAQRKIKDPGVGHIQKLANYFRASEATV